MTTARPPAQVCGAAIAASLPIFFTTSTTEQIARRHPLPTGGRSHGRSRHSGAVHCSLYVTSGSP